MSWHGNGPTDPQKESVNYIYYSSYNCYTTTNYKGDFKGTFCYYHCHSTQGNIHTSSFVHNIIIKQINNIWFQSPMNQDVSTPHYHSLSFSILVKLLLNRFFSVCTDDSWVCNLLFLSFNSIFIDSSFNPFSVKFERSSVLIEVFFTSSISSLV